MLKIVSLLGFFLISCSMWGNSEPDISITLRSPTPNSMYITWETVFDIQYYILFQYFENDGIYKYLATVSDRNSFLHTGLSPSRRYVYRLAHYYNDTRVFLGQRFFGITSPHIIAHRGYHYGIEGSAENSIQSLRAAAELGVFGSEFDVHVTADNIPVIHHAPHIQGKEGNIRIEAASYDEIRDLVLFNGERLPTLDDYLRAAKELSIQLILELKAYTGNAERHREIAQIVVDRVNYFGLGDRVEYITFNLNIGKEFIRITDSKVSLLDGDLSPEELNNLGFHGIAFSYSRMQANPQYFNSARKLGMSINVWTVNVLSLMEKMVNSGADLITTSIPSIAKFFFSNRVFHYEF